VTKPKAKPPKVIVPDAPKPTPNERKPPRVILLSTPVGVSIDDAIAEGSVRIANVAGTCPACGNPRSGICAACGNP
jgi:hypothetical protein